ncbi:MAG TPA: xanthine dehydrogenase family protein subunit M [Candidatus Caldiarchaeum subterraneum]|uniref:Xanthine dehydrogenase family protein subunit M n=1 Tax=Caldiarchaeum subterraneum TaxID=311458 RepID=A0A832ZVP2_CALS0|nr:xanthine dehydrogenase family protein subunit M [Candidatus Caldarchaeum subterraneum]
MNRLHDIEVYSPKTLEEALEILRREGDRVKVIAGGTDLIIQMKDGIMPRKNLLNIYSIDELRYIRMGNDSIRIGALTSFTDIASSALIRNYARILADAANTIGSIQIMNKASIGGNLVNASPAADSIPPLYVLDAVLVLRSVEGVREVPIQSFYRGYKKLDIRSDELLTEVRVRRMAEDEDGIFLKHGLRLGDAISVVNAALLVKWDGDDRFKDVKIALGAVAPTVVRARSCEEALTGKELNDSTIWDAASKVVNDISPIDDVRGTAEYRREMSVNLLYIGLWEIINKRNQAGW